MERLLAIMARLRDPRGGCPWDREQSFASLIPHTLEEAYEVAEAIEHGTPEDLRDELGDLLFQVVFYAQLAKEAGNFQFEDVAASIADKLVCRHPHVFGDTQVADAVAQTAAWEQHKAEERRRKDQGGVLDGVSHALPALTRAVKLSRRAARVGFDWPSLATVLDKVQEELNEVRAEVSSPANPQRLAEEIGDLLFSCANLARHADADPETVLRAANTRFEARFRAVEAHLAAQGRTPAEASLDEMDTLWQAIKAKPATGQ